MSESDPLQPLGYKAIAQVDASPGPWRVLVPLQGGKRIGVREYLSAWDLDPLRLVLVRQIWNSLADPACVLAGPIRRTRTGSMVLQSDWVDGPSVEELAPLPVSRVREILEQLARVLDALHALGWYHGHLAAHAVRFTAEGMPVVLNWWCCLPEGSEVGTLVEALRPDTPPEALRGEPLSYRTDMWGLGVLGWTLLTGSHPFASVRDDALAGCLLAGPPPATELRGTGEAQELLRLLQRLLSPEPAARQQAWETFLAPPSGKQKQERSLTVDFRASMPRSLQASASAGWDAIQVATTSRGALLEARAPTGGGKSRLLRVLRADCLREGIPSVWFQATPSQVPLVAWRQILLALRAALSSRDESAAALCSDALAALDQRCQDPLVPLRLDERPLDHLVAAGNGLFDALAQRGPLVCFIDGWEALDEPSQSLLRAVLRVERPGLVWVVSTRAGLGDLPARSLPVKAPDDHDFEDWLAAIFQLPRVPSRFAAALRRHSGGDYQRAADLLAQLTSKRVIVETPGGWRLPETLWPQVLDASAERESSGEADSVADGRDIICLVALTHPDGLLDWAGLLAAEAPEQALRHLSALLGLGRARLYPAGILLANDELAWGREHLAPATRQAHHQRLANYVELSPVAPWWPVTSRSLRLAYHESAAGVDASKQWHDAGWYALSLGATSTAETCFLALLGGLHTAMVAIAVQEDALEGLAWVAAQKADWQAARGQLERAIALNAGRPGNTRDLQLALAICLHRSGGLRERERARESLEVLCAESSLESLRWGRFRPRLELATILLGEHRLQEAEAVLHSLRAEQVAVPGDIGAWLAAATALLRCQTVKDWQTPLFEEAVTALLDCPDALSSLKYDMLTQLVALAWSLGRWRELRQVMPDWLLLSERRESEEQLAGRRLRHALVLAECGSLDQALEVLPRAALDQADNGLLLQQSQALQGWVLVEQGRLEEAFALLERLLEAYGASPTSELEWPLSRLAHAACRVGLQEELQACLDRLAVHWAPGQPDTAEWFLARSHLRLSRGEWEAARADALRALPANSNLAAQTEARLQLASIRLAVGDASGAADALAGLGEPLKSAGARRALAYLECLQGECSLLRGGSDAARHFQLARHHADEMGLPWLTARALDGSGRCNPLAEAAIANFQDAQRLLRRMLGTLPADRRAQVASQEGVKTVLERVWAGGGTLLLSAEAHQDMLQRFGQITSDLSGVTSHYGLMIRAWGAKREQLATFNRMVASINASLVVDDVAQAVLRVALELTGAERAFALLKSQGRYEDLLVRAGLDRGGRDIRNQPLSMSVCLRVAARREPAALIEGQKLEDFEPGKSVAALNLKAVMVAPMIAKGRCLGVLYVDSQAARVAYSLQDLDQLALVASHASTAFENATLYEGIARHTEELEKQLRAVRQADRVANLDALTGLRNRRAFLATADRELALARRQNRALALLCFEVDHFQETREQFGPAVGDQILQRVGQVLADAARETDLVARLGGEAFVVLCPETPGTDALNLAHRASAQIRASHERQSPDDPLPPVKVSCGVADWRPADGTINVVLARAQEALQRARLEGTPEPGT
ncbi:MAG: diguanylate cyclase [Candidatus Sericytochromatia bacterium]|nr:diguanylate cyclase [Candidatus Sericytochromatia bacterium]